MSSLFTEEARLLFESAPGLYLVLEPDFTIAAVTDAYLCATGTNREQLISRNIFEVFPDNAEDRSDDESNCMHNLRASLNYVIKNGRSQTMAVQRYSLPGPDGLPAERYWRPFNKPVFNSDQQLLFIIHQVEDVTKHKIAEQKFYDYLESATEATIIMGDDGDMKIANKRACLLFGYSKEELIDKPVEILLPDELKKMHQHRRSSFEDAAGLKEMNSGETFTATRKNGERFPVEINLSLVNSDEEILVSASIKDLTERKQQQEKLELLSKQIDQANDAIFTVDAERRITSWNRGAEKMYGYSKEEALGKVSHDLLQTDMDAKEIEALSRKIAGENHYTVDLKRKTKAGDDIFVKLSTTSIKSPAGELTGYVAVNFDITEQKKLREQVDYLAQITEQSSEAIMSRNSDNCLVSWNKGAEHLFGYSKEEALGRKAIDLGIIRFTPEEMIEVAAELAGKGNWKAEKLFFHKNGTGFWGSVTANVIKNEHGKKLSEVFVVKDISTEKQLEARLIQANEELEQKVKERTAEILKSEKKYRHLFENNPMPMWITDMDTLKFLDVNKIAVERYGYSREEFLGMTATDIRPDDEKVPFVEYVHTQENDETNYHNRVWQHQKKDGSIIQVEVIVHHIFFEGSKARLVLANDVTEKVKANERLAASEQRFRALIENNYDIISLMDRSFNLIYRSPSAERIMGWSNDSMKGRNATVNIHPDDQQMARGIIEELMVSPGKSFYTSFRNKHKDGHYLWVEGSLVNRLEEPGINAIVFNFRDITARKAAEQKLHANEERFRALIENNNDMISLLDASFKVLYRSPSSTRITGWTDDDVKEMSMLKTVHPDDLITHEKNIRSIFSTPGSSINTTVRILHKKGHYIWMEGSIKNLLQDETIKAFVFNFRDVTEQKLAEEKISASEERYRHTLDNMLEGVQILDFDLRYVYVNDAMAKQARYPKTELIGYTLPDKFPGIEQTSVFRSYQYCLHERQPLHLENEFIFPDGSIGWFELSFQPIPEGLFILSVDITERKESEAKLNDQRAQLKTLGDNLTGVMIYQLIGDIDGKRRFTYVSDGVKNLTGKTPEEVMADPSVLYTMILEEDREQFILAELEASRKMGIFNTEVRCRTHKNEIRWLNIVSTPRLQENGQIVWDGFHIDVTDRKEVEERMKHLNQELEEKIAVRTEQLKKSNQEMEAFSYSVSHDLRAPLRGIIGFTNILEEEYSSKLDAEAKRITDVIKSNTLKMGNLIDDLLAFSRIGQQEIEKMMIDSNELVKQAILSLDHKNKQAEWVIPTLDKAFGDYNTLRQVWVNLISNAVKYSSGQQFQRIEIGSYEAETEVIFFIKDNGVGFDEKYADKLFKVFQRLHSTTEFEGTGIGLAILEKIISKHGGRVWASAVKGAGASFYFSLPNKQIESI